MSSAITLPAGLPLQLDPTSLINFGTGLINYGAGLTVAPSQLMWLMGGTLTGTTYSSVLNVLPGGALGGFGTITGPNGGIADNGTIVASGGTLLLNAGLSGAGELEIAAHSTAELGSAALGNVGVVFGGQGATLDLTQNIIGNGTIQDFGLGDLIKIPGVTGTVYNTGDNVLSLTNAGHVVDQLHFAGSYQGNSFSFSQSGVDAVIGFNAVHT